MTGINRVLKEAYPLAVVVVMLGVLVVPTGASDTEESVSSEAVVASGESSSGKHEEFPVPFKPLPKTITPCRACHGPEKDFKVNLTREEVLRVHTNIRLDHGGVRVWCLDCHSPTERNYLLPLSDGKLITFEKSFELCGKCHGTKYRDWRHGIHGKRTGYWNGKKTYFLCTQCHNPHSPRFKAINPMPPPKKPRTPIEADAKH